MRTLANAIIITAFITGLSGCGIKGNLELPQTESNYEDGPLEVK
jgi:predicted small lipoprotein YifL